MPPPLPQRLPAVQSRSVAPNIAAMSGKDRLRWLTFQRLQNHPYQEQPMPKPTTDYRIPDVANVDAAAQRLAGTIEFSNAEHILVFNQTNTEAVALSAVYHGKQLYVPSPANCPTAFTRVKPPPGGMQTGGALAPKFYHDNSMRQMQSRRENYIKDLCAIYVYFQTRLRACWRRQ